MRCHKRSRKGGAVKLGWDAYPDADFYCLLDGDGAISAEVIIGLMSKAAQDVDGEVSVVGVRHSNSTENLVHRTLLRQLLFCGFSFLLHFLLKEPWLDTQCGAKVIHGDAYRSIRPSLVEAGFVFDAELLTRLSHSGYAIREIPIPWQEVPGSKLSLLTDSCRILIGLVRIRLRLGKQ
jgi:dolichyl-phosphate beta-glucosyltransferase